MRVKPFAVAWIAQSFIIGLLAGAASAQASGNEAPEALQAETPQAVTSQAKSSLGSYLAGRVARGRNDTPVAATYYGKALATDPDSEILLDAAFLTEATAGADWARVEDLANKLAKLRPYHRAARAFLGLAAFKAGRYQEAEEHFKASSANPIGELTSALARAWTYQAQNRTQDAINLLDSHRLPDWANYFLRYHRALIADVGGRTADARTSFDRMSKNDQRALRVTLAFARHAANAGDTRLAQSLLNAYLERTKGEGHPYARELQLELESGKRPSLLITSAVQGMAEVFYGLGEALSGEGSSGIGTVFLQYALYLTPDSAFPLVTLASINEANKRYEAAIDAYERVPAGTPFEVNIDVRKALNLNQLERVDEAQKLLEGLANKYPQDIRPLDALGGIMRGHKRYSEAAQYYTRAIDLIDKPEPKHWTYFYARGTSFERMKMLQESESDLERSLKLSPDQPLTLNYLGYTWIDHNRNLRQGLKLIEKAVRLKSDDGYIVDSLGWAHYRLGNFKEAVKHLERAVELRPEDPTLNDHLGDAYWRVGRQREARFQWDQALSFNPEQEEVSKIRDKLENGLPPLPQARKGKTKRKTVKQQVQKNKKSTQSGPAPQFPWFQ
jgi:tetratricopeptide (TPR) repeat protein